MDNNQMNGSQMNNNPMNSNQSQPPYEPPTAYELESESGRKLGIISFVLAICAILSIGLIFVIDSYLLPVLFLLLFEIPGLILGIMSIRRRKHKNALGIIGFILSLILLILSIAILMLFIVLVLVIGISFSSLGQLGMIM